MEGLGFPLLDRITLFEIMVMTIPGITVYIDQGFHGHDGPNTTQLVLVLDGDAGVFDDSTDNCTARFVAFAMSTPRTRRMDESGLHRE